MSSNTTAPPLGKQVHSTAARGWYVVARSSELGSTAITAARIATSSLVGYRGESGTAYVVDAHCARRGCPLAVGEVVGESIRCQLDGWVWAPDGTGTDDTAAAPSGLMLRHYRVHESAGLILAQLDGAGSAPDLGLFDGTSTCSDSGSVEAHPYAVVEGVVDPLTLRYALQADSVTGPQVLVQQADDLQLRYQAEVSGAERTIDVRAYGPGLVTVTDGCGGAVLALNPTGPGALHVRSLACVSADPTSPIDWAAFTERQLAVARAVEYTDGVCLSPAEELARNTVRTWLRADEQR